MYEGLGRYGLRTRMDFRYAEPDDDPSLWVTPGQLAEGKIAFGYVDASLCLTSDVINVLADQLKTDHPRYSMAERGWLRFMDDLETLAHQRAGLVIVVDNAADLFSDRSSWGFELLKWWTMQIWHWAKQDKPCQLCFQMDASSAVKQIYASR